MLCGILLILDGFLGFNVRVVAVVAGLILVGALPAQWLTDLLALGRGRRDRGEVEDP